MGTAVGGDAVGAVTRAVVLDLGAAAATTGKKLELEAVARYTGERATEEMDQRTCSDTMMN